MRFIRIVFLQKHYIYCTANEILLSNKNYYYNSECNCVTFVVRILTSRLILEANLRGIMRRTFEESRMNYHILFAAFYELDPIATRRTLEIKRGERGLGDQYFSINDSMKITAFPT